MCFHQVLFPVFLPGEGTFHWLDWLAHHAWLGKLEGFLCNEILTCRPCMMQWNPFKALRSPDRPTSSMIILHAWSSQVSERASRVYGDQWSQNGRLVRLPTVEIVESLSVVWIRQPVSTCFVRKMHDSRSIAPFLSVQIDFKVETFAEWHPTLHWHRVVCASWNCSLIQILHIHHAFMISSYVLIFHTLVPCLCHFDIFWHCNLWSCRCTKSGIKRAWRDATRPASSFQVCLPGYEIYELVITCICLTCLAYSISLDQTVLYNSKIM